MGAWRRGIDGTGNPLGFPGRHSLSIKKSKLGLKNPSPDSFGFVGIHLSYCLNVCILYSINSLLISSIIFFIIVLCLYDQVIGVKLTGDLKGWTSPKGTCIFNFFLSFYMFLNLFCGKVSLCCCPFVYRYYP